MSNILRLGILQQTRNLNSDGSPGNWILNFSNISGSMQAYTSTESILDNITLHITASASNRYATIYWLKNGGSTTAYMGNNYYSRTMAFNINDTIRFRVTSWYRVNGTITLRENDINGRVLAQFNYSVSGW